MTNPFVPATTSLEGVHAEPTQVSGLCRKGLPHAWDLVGEHLACSVCGWLACCGVRLHLLPAVIDKPCQGQEEHDWGLNGVHWRCNHCCHVPCCTYNSRRSKMGPRRRIQLVREAGRCHWCGVAFGGEGVGSKPTIDHLLPRSFGGRHQDANVVVACWWCNQHRGTMTVAEWEASEELQSRRVYVFRLTLRAMGVHPRSGSYIHRETFERIDGVSRCSLCGATGMPREIGTVPCVQFPS